MKPIPRRRLGRIKNFLGNPGVGIAAIVTSVLMLLLVIWVGNRQPSVDQLDPGKIRNNYWQPGEGYIPPQESGGDSPESSPLERFNAPGQQGISPSAASPIYEIRTDPAFPAFYPARIEAEAGSTACVRFENTSTQDHHDNFMLVQPGTERQVGIEAVRVGQKGGYIPVMPREIIAHTRTLPPGESETVCFRVPDRPGEYPFISSARNRWEAMRGILEVTPPR